MRRGVQVTHGAWDSRQGVFMFVWVGGKVIKNRGGGEVSEETLFSCFVGLRA